MKEGNLCAGGCLHFQVLSKKGKGYFSLCSPEVESPFLEARLGEVVGPGILPRRISVYIQRRIKPGKYHL